jgi:hypothetical protein
VFWRGEYPQPFSSIDFQQKGSLVKKQKQMEKATPVMSYHIISFHFFGLLLSGFLVKKQKKNEGAAPTTSYYVISFHRFTSFWLLGKETLVYFFLAL